MWIQKKKGVHIVDYSCCGISIGHYKVTLENIVVENWMQFSQKFISTLKALI